MAIVDIIVNVIIIIINIFIGFIISIFNCYNVIPSLPSLNLMNGTLKIPSIICNLCIPIGSIRLDSISWTSMSIVLSRANGLHLDIKVDGLTFEITIDDIGKMKLENNNNSNNNNNNNNNNNQNTNTNNSNTNSNTNNDNSDSNKKMKERINNIIKFIQKWIKGLNFTYSNIFLNININNDNDNDNDDYSSLKFMIENVETLVSFKPTIELSLKGNNIELKYDSSLLVSSLDILSLSSYSINTKVNINDNDDNCILSDINVVISIGVLSLFIDIEPVVHNIFMDFIKDLLNRIKRTPSIEMLIESCKNKEDRILDGDGTENSITADTANLNRNGKVPTNAINNTMSISSTNKWLIINHDINIVFHDISICVSYNGIRKNKVIKENLISFKNITVGIETINERKMYNYNGLDKVYWSNLQQIVFGVKVISSDCTNRHECFPIGDTIAESKSLHGKIIKESKVYDLDSLKFSSNLECDIEPIKLELNIEAISGLLHFVKDITTIISTINMTCLMYRNNYGYHFKTNNNKISPTLVESKQSIRGDCIQIALIGKANETYCNLLSIRNFSQRVDIDNSGINIEAITLSSFKPREINSIGNIRECLKVSGLSVRKLNSNILQSQDPDIFENMDSHGWRKFIDTSHDSIIPSSTSIESIQVYFHPTDAYNLGFMVGTLSSSSSPPLLYAREPSIATNISNINPINFRFARSLTVIRELAIDMQWDASSGNDYYLKTDKKSSGIVKIRTGGLLLDSCSYGTIVSKMSMSLGKEITIDICKDGSVTRAMSIDSYSENNYSFDENNIFTKDGQSLTPLFSTLKHPHELIWHSNNSSCLNVTSVHTNLCAEKFQLKLDSGVLHHLNRFISVFKTGQVRSKEYVESILKGYRSLSHHDTDTITLGANSPFKPLSRPISIFLIDFNCLDLCLSDDMKPVALLGGKQLKVYMISFGPIMKQTVGNIKAAYLIDQALPNALHRNIIWSNPNDEMNSIDFHMSNLKGSPGLLELKVDRLRVIYLNRIVNTLTCFFRDYCIPSIKKSLAANIPVPNPLLYPAQVKAPTPVRGMFRVCVRIRKLEAHLPMGCHGTDAFTVLCKDAHFIKVCPETDFDYCLGPLMSKNIDLFEYENAKWSFAAIATHRNTNHRSSSHIDLFESNINPLASQSNMSKVILDKVLWKLPQHAYKELRAPDNCRFGASKGSFDIQLNNTTIASWCNQNAVGDHMNLHLIIALTRIVQAYDGMYGETLTQQEFAIKTKGNRNFILVDIEIEDICWTLAQGQYLNICRMLQTNFHEVNRVVPDSFIIPKPKRVHLTEKLFGSYLMDRRLPIASSVPLRIRKGQISIAENSSDYYDLVSRLLNVPSTPIINNLQTPNDIDSIPSWSWHNYHRDRIFNGIESSIRPRLGEYIMTLHVRGLVVEFYRRHYGGGNGIEVTAENLIMTSCEVAPDDDDGDEDKYSQFSIDDISSDNIILAPKNLAQLNQKSRLGDRGAGSFLDFDDDESLSDDSASTFPEQLKDRNYSGEFVEPNKFHEPCIRYRQQGNGNLRRCVIEINDSVLILNVPKLQRIGSFFGEPVQLGFQRHLARIKASGVENPDFKASMDLEIHAKNTIFCLTNKSKREGTSAFCLNANLDYTNAVRGFLRVGPGRVTTKINLDVKHVYIAPLHEIKETGCQTLIDPFNLSLDMGLIVSIDEKKLNHNLSLLYNYIDFSSFVAKNHKLDSPVGIRTISAKLVPGTSKVDADSDESSSLNVRLSLKDIGFIKTAVQQLTQSMAGNTPRPTIAERYGSQFSSFQDYEHLPTLAQVLVHVNDSAQWQLVEREIVVDICKVEILLRNNIYNSNIAKVNLNDLRFSYHKNYDLLHMAAGLTASAWSYNDPHDAWEPVIESASMSAVAATDSTFSSPDTSLDTSRVRVDAYCNPIEINASQSTITKLIRKIAMADVITTTSIHLPPYRIVNELGIPVKSIIKIGEIDIITSLIEVGTHLPIEMNSLTEASKIRKRRSSNKIDVTKKEYALSISFELDNSVFSSTDAIPLDREGTYPFQMKESTKPTSSQKSKKYDSSPNRNSFDDTSSTKRAASTSFSNIPHTVVSVHVKEDGGRELVLRSLLSLTNSTSRTFYVLVKHGAEKAETYLNPGMEWYIPIYVAHPRASLYFRVDHRSEWVQVLSSFAVLVQQGTWGAPSRLQAELCACPPENPTQDSVETSWVLLLRPEVRDMKDGPASRTLVNVKYPSESNYKGNVGGPDGLEGLTTVDDIYNNINFTGSMNSLVNLGQPMCVQLLAPLQICNLVCQPLLYRLADKDGIITSEGILLPGHVVDIHSVFQLFTKQIYLSLRMINYCWSKWTKILSRRVPYVLSEKVIDVTLQSMELTHEGNSLNLPPINISMSIREHFVRLSCPILISNRTGFELDFCEPSAQDFYLPLDSSSPAESLMPTVTIAQNPSIQTLNSSSTKISTDNTNGENDDLIGLGFDEESLSSRSSYDSDNSNNDVSRKVPSRGNIMSTIIHLPMDHLRKIEVFVSAEWTLQDVLMQISKYFPNVPIHQLQSSYVFFPWEAGKHGPQKVDHSPAVEVDLFTSRNTTAGDTREVGDAMEEGGQFDERGQSVSGKQSRFDSITSRFTQSGKGGQSGKQYFSSSLFSSSNSETIPPSVQFSMVADCHLDPLPLSTKVSALQQNRIRLCHVTEWNIYKQIHSIQTSQVVQEGKLMKMLSTKKFSHKAVFMKMDGDIPFYTKKLLGQPSLSLRVPKQTEWSDSIDLLKSDFGSTFTNDDIINVGIAAGPRSQGYNCRQFQFGAYIEKGKGLYQNISSVSVVPKYIVISKLAAAIQIRQVGVSDTNQYLTLHPENSKYFHYTSRNSPQMIQVRRLPSLSIDAPDTDGDEWYGELDVSKLGLVYGKLRDPQTILKLQTQLVGASLVTTISEQSHLWPPYRLQNSSQFGIRFRQSYKLQESMTTTLERSLNSKVESADDLTRQDVAELADPADASKFSSIPWDYLSARLSRSYAWDFPQSEDKVLKVEFSQGQNMKGIRLDIDDVSKVRSLILMRPLPGLGNPLAEGALMRRGSEKDEWINTYCILKADVFYMFRDETRSDLVGIINLSRHSDSGLQMASVKKIEDKGWDFMGSISKKINELTRSSSDSLRLDNNQIRILMLTIADQLGLFPLYASPSPEECTASAGTESLAARLKQGAATEQLLEFLSRFSLKYGDILLSMLDCKVALDIAEAINIFNFLFKNRFVASHDITIGTVSYYNVTSREHVSVPFTPFTYDNDKTTGRALLNDSKDSLQFDLNADFHFNIPSLHPELFEQSADQANDSTINSSDEKGFIITLGEAKYYFLCGSRDEFLGWIQGCRRSIELGWVMYTRGDKFEEDRVTLENFKVKVDISVKTDGQTNIIDISEDATYKVRNQTTRPLELTRSNSDILEGSSSTQTVETDDEGKVAVDADSGFTCSIKFESISLSLIDLEPAEILYLQLKDIDVSVEHSSECLRVAGTIQGIQVSNQLLNPAFQVMLFQRKCKHVNRRLMLPGLHQLSDNFPTLHIFFQQKFFKYDEVEKKEVVGDDKLLTYYELATLWIAPLQLDIDEEAIVRILRFFQGVREALSKRDFGAADQLKEEILALQHLGNKSWGHTNRSTISQGFNKLQTCGETVYRNYIPLEKTSKNMYFSLLQLHPIDIITTVRPVPAFHLTNTEVALVSICAQLDCARICLNALVAENAYGSAAIISNIVTKHYQAALWKNIKALLGTSSNEPVNDGQVANLGGGVYGDMFYEPIDGLVHDENSTLDGISKAGKGVASRAIGGMSKVTGGVGKGLAMLTVDKNFFRNREFRRYNKASTVSEGIYVGTKELGKNIAEGLSGIVVSPYRGWEEGGMKGFAKGVGKGLLGAAIKPAVGVLDLASRAAEGMKSSAFGTPALDREGVYRSRIPRAFGRGRILQLFDSQAAAAQFLANKITDFKRDPRFITFYHNHCIRSPKTMPLNEQQSNQAYLPVLSAKGLQGRLLTPFHMGDIGYKDYVTVTESWGLHENQSYVTLVGSNRVMLTQVLTNGADGVEFKLIWSCPASCIEQLYSDALGDLVLNVSTPVTTIGDWDSPSPTIHDPQYQDYFVFQQLLEQTIGPNLARMQPLKLKRTQGLLQRDILKRYATGIKSIFMSPTEHTYQLFGYILYEYTNTQKKTYFGDTRNISDSPRNLTTDSGGAGGGVGGGVQSSPSATNEESKNLMSSKSSVATPGNDKIKDPTLQKVGEIFSAKSAPSLSSQYTANVEGVLSYCYPLVDVLITSPVREDGDKYAISISRKDGQSMRILKRDDDTGRMMEHHKSILSLIFDDIKVAATWKIQLEAHIALQPPDVIPSSTIVTEKKKFISMAMKTISERFGKPNENEPLQHSITSLLVIPTSGVDRQSTEDLKIEIAQTLSE